MPASEALMETFFFFSFAWAALNEQADKNYNWPLGRASLSISN